MKKILSLILTIILASLLVLSFASCKKDKGDDTKADVNVSVLNGTTGFGMAYLMEENANGNASNNYTFSVETDASVISKGLINGSIDIAALPTNAASVLYNKPNSPVKIIAINTLGVLYLVENGSSVNSISDLQGKTIYCPANNPAYIMQYLLNKNNINATIDTTYSTPALLNQAVSSGALNSENVIAVLPEPVLTTAMKDNSSLSVRLDLTEEWNKVESTQLVQGCVVVRTEYLNNNPDAVNKFLAEYKESIEYLQVNVSSAADLIVKHNIFANKNVAEIAIPKCNVTYMDGQEMKTAMNGFLTAMSTVDISSIGGTIPDDAFYYIQ